MWTRAPHRKPVLGWYDETNPEVIDWQIKYLAENGVAFTFVDWYWRMGGQWHNHWMKAFAKARYRRHLKWALMWCAHGQRSTSEEDMRNVTKFWIDAYFRDPQYMRIDGRPAVSIWSLGELSRKIGAAGFRRICADARRFAYETGVTRLLMVPLNYAPEDVGLGPYPCATAQLR